MITLIQHFRPTRRLYCILAGSALASSCIYALEQIPGVAAVTSVNGEVGLISQEGRRKTPELHQSLDVNGAQLETAAKAGIVLSLSNGIGLAVGEQSKLRIREYNQQPFDERHQGLQFEPSVSTLQLQLDVGTAALAFEHLSPLSSADIHLPVGKLRVHSGKVVAQVSNAESSTVLVLAGSATLNYHDSGERAFLSAGQCARFTIGSTEPIYIDDASRMPTGSALLGDAADYARQRVFFRWLDDVQAPHAIWVTPTDRLEKAPEHPYSFEL